MKSLVLMLCLIPMVATAEIQFTYKNGTKMCGKFIDNGKAYCRTIDGGEMCLQKSELAFVKTVKECDDEEMSGNGTAYLKAHNMSAGDLLAKKRAKDELEGYSEYREPAQKAVKIRKKPVEYPAHPDYE